MADQRRGPDSDREGGPNTLLRRTCDEYRRVLNIEDEDERRAQLYRLAERFFYAPENVALRQRRLRARGYDGTEDDLMARGGEKGPFYRALDDIIDWFPELLDSDGTASFPGWNTLVRAWFWDWYDMTHGTCNHPRVSLDALGTDGAVLGASPFQSGGQGPGFDPDDQLAAFEVKTGISPSDLHAVAGRVSARGARPSVHAFRRILLAKPEPENAKGLSDADSDVIEEALRDSPGVFWRRHVLVANLSDPSR